MISNSYLSRRSKPSSANAFSKKLWSSTKKEEPPATLSKLPGALRPKAQSCQNPLRPLSLLPQYYCQIHSVLQLLLILILILILIHHRQREACGRPTRVSLPLLCWTKRTSWLIQAQRLARFVCTKWAVLMPTYLQTCRSNWGEHDNNNNEPSPNCSPNRC